MEATPSFSSARTPFSAARDPVEEPDGSRLRRRNEHIQRLESAGIDVTAAHRNDQFELRDWTDTHLRGGQLGQREMLALFEEVVKEAEQQGFPLIRFVTYMEWALETERDLNDLLEYLVNRCR
jgi:hypothetical protein